MSYMKDSSGRRLDSFKVADAVALRRRDLPGYAGLPTLMPSPPTYTLGAANAASVIPGSQSVLPERPGAFTYSGTDPKYGSSGATIYGVSANPVFANTSTPSPFAAEFDFDTQSGLFEVGISATNAGVRVLVNGQYVTQGPTFKPPFDGNGYLGKVDLGAPGFYRIRLEFDAGSIFLSLRCSPLDTVSQAGRITRRHLLIGDSFAEPTIWDTAPSSSWDGFGQLLGYLLGVEMWSGASGGTGYLNPNAGAGRQKYRDRIAGYAAYAFDEVWVTGGYNDAGGYTPAAVTTEAGLLFAAIRSAWPKARINVVSPFWRGGPAVWPNTLIPMRDGIKTAALGVGATFLDVMQQTPAASRPLPAATTLNGGSGVGAGNITTHALIKPGTWVQIDTGVNAEMRLVTSTAGSSDPFTLYLDNGTDFPLTVAHANGTTVTPVGAPFITGDGKLGATTGKGTADRYCGTDGTHPSIAGHANLARHIYHAYAATLEG